MRLTSVLFKLHKGRRFKVLWKLEANRKLVEYPVPQILIEKGVKIWEAKDIADPPPKLEIIPIPPPWSPPSPRNETHPNWKPRLCRVFTMNTRLLEGLQQAQLLTKTLVYDGLPENVQSLTGIAEQSDQDELLKRQILLSHVFDGWQVRLPKRIDLKKPGWVFPRDYGTPLRRKIDLLLQNIIRLLYSQSGMYTDITKRNILTNSHAVVTEEKNGDLLQFNATADILVSSDKPLAPFVSMEKVMNEKSSTLPSIYPVNYTIDLIPTHIYDIKDFHPIVKQSSFPFVHTIFIINTDPIYKWSKSQTLAKALITCYTFAVSQAKRLYGDQDLPTPVAVQCVISDGRRFSFLAYQLNTMNPHNDSNIKNMAWIESDMLLYDTCTENTGKAIFEGYKPDVYRNMLALHLNGVNLEDSIVLNVLKPSQNYEVQTEK